MYRRIVNFIDDLNCESIILNIRFVSKKRLYGKLRSDGIKYLWGLNTAQYVIIENSNLRAFKSERDIPENYKIVTLFEDGNGYYFKEKIGVKSI